MLNSKYLKILIQAFLCWLIFSIIAPVYGQKPVLPLREKNSGITDTLIVENNLDDGPGSLRSAIQAANDQDKKISILIRLIEPADSILYINSPLPAFTAKIQMSVAYPFQKFILDGSNLSDISDHGIRIMSDSVSLSGIQIRQFPGSGISVLSNLKDVLIKFNTLAFNGRLEQFGNGIFLQNAVSVHLHGNLIKNNFLSGIEIRNCTKTTVTGNHIHSNKGNGIYVFRSDSIVIGDSCTDCTNLIHSNLQSGISLEECFDEVRLYKNIVGTNMETTLALPNGQNGLLISRCENVFVGDQSRENYFSGNLINGITVRDSSAYIFIHSNRIGYTKFNYFGIPNRQKGIEVLQSSDIHIGGYQLTNGNLIGYGPVNIFVGDGSARVSLLNNTYFCSPFGVMLENGSNFEFQPDFQYMIQHARLISGQFLPGSYIQIYKKRTECTTCQGSDLLGAVYAGLNGNWSILLDQPLLDGEVMTILMTDAEGNSTGFGPCTQFNCVPEKQVTILSGGTDRMCAGDQLLLSTDFGTLHQWNTGENSAQIMVDTGGWYSVQVIDQNGCSTTDSIFIQYFPRPSLSLIPTDSAYFCGETAILRAFGQGEFLWNTGVYSPVIEISDEGTYCVSLTNEFQCVSSDCVYMMKGEPVEAGILLLGDPEFCEGDSVIMIATGGTSFTWSNGITDDDRITAFEGGLYQVTVTNEQGCFDVANQNVTTFPGVAATIDQPEYVELCPGDTIVLTAGGGSQFKWNNGSTSRQIKVNKTGIYEVRVSNEYGCSDKAICIVSMLPAFQSALESGQLEACEGDSIEIQTVGAELDSLVWSNGQKGNIIGFDRSGVYQVRMYKYGCFIEEFVDVIIHPSPVVDSLKGPVWVEPGAYASYEVGSVNIGSDYSWRVEGGRITDQTVPGKVLVEWYGEPGALICVSETSAEGCTGEEKCLEIQIISAVINEGPAEWVRVFPNPAHNMIFISPAEGMVLPDLEVTFIDQQGKIVKSFQPENEEGSFTIDISALLPGVYHLKVPGGHQPDKWMKLFIIQ